MGFLPRFLSLSLRRKKKKEMPPPPPPLPRPSAASAMPPPSMSSLTLPMVADGAQRRVSENELLRMSSRNCSVYSEIDYLAGDAPPIPHPINEVMRSHSRASTVDRQSSYVVRVHSRQSNVVRSSTSTSASEKPPVARKPVPVRPVTPPPPSTPKRSIVTALSPEDARQLARLRSDASVSDLVGLYARQEHNLNDQFRNTPARERKQRKRASTDLRSLLHVGADDDSDHEEGESGDVLTWADRIIDATMVSASTVAPNDTPRKNNEQDTSFSSLAVEAGSADAHARDPSDESPVQVLPQETDERPQLQRSGSVRASVVFDFLLRKKDDQGPSDPDRSVGSLRRTASSGAVLSGASTVAPAREPIIRSSTTSVMLNALEDKHAARSGQSAGFVPSRTVHVPYPGVGTRPGAATAHLQDQTTRTRTASAPLQAGQNSAAQSKQPDNDKGTEHSTGFQREILMSRQTSVHALASKFNAGVVGTGRIGGPRPMRTPSPVKSRAPLFNNPPVPIAPVTTAPPKPRMLGNSNAAAPVAIQQGVFTSTRAAKHVPFVYNDDANPFVPTKPSALTAADLGYVEIEEKENVFPRPTLLEAPSPAPSRASSSELSPAAQKMMSDIRLKRGTSRRDVWQ